MGKIDFETVLVKSAKLPLVKVDRELFLRKELKNRYDKEAVFKRRFSKLGQKSEKNN